MYYGNNSTSGRRFFQEFGGNAPRPGMPPLQPPPMGPPGLRGPVWASGPGPMMGAGPFRPQFPIFRPPVFNGPLMNYFPPDNFETPSANMAANQRNCIGENRPDDYKRYDCFENFNAKDEIKLDVELSSRQCTVKWWPIAKLSAADFEYCYEVSCQGGSMVKSERFSAKLNEVSLKTIPGHDYKFKLTLMKKGTTEAYLQNTIDFRAVFNLDEIGELYELARRFIGDTPLQNFTLLYRCKPRHYFDDVINNRNGIMEKYIKDDNGHRASPINGKLRGLFFSGEKIDNKLPAFSPFGDVRITIPVDKLIRPGFVNLYFCDFYCNSKPHYVTVVICQKGSHPDDFCKRNAKPLDLYSNPFFRVVPKSEGAPGPDYLFFVSNAVHVEICYTENVPLSMGKMSPVQPFGRGSSRIGGLRNNIHCEICNFKKTTEKERPDAAQGAQVETFKPEDLAISLKEEETEQNNPDPNMEMEAEHERPSQTLTTHLDFPQRYDRSMFGFLPDESVIRKMHIENSVGSDEQQKEINEAVVKCVFSLVENTATELEEKPRTLKILQKFSGNSKNGKRFSALFDKLRDVLLPPRKRKLLKDALEKNTALQAVIKASDEAVDEVSKKRMKLEIQDEVEIDLTKMDHEEQPQNDPETVEMFEKFYESTEGVDIEEELHGEDRFGAGKSGEREAREADQSDADKTLTQSELDLTVVGDNFFASTTHHPEDPQNGKEFSIEEEIDEIFKGLDEYDRKALERKEKGAAESKENALNTSASSCPEIDEENAKAEKELMESVKKEIEMAVIAANRDLNVGQSGDQGNMASGEAIFEVEHDQESEDKEWNDSMGSQGDVDRDVNVDDSQDQDVRIKAQEEAVQQQVQEESKDSQDVVEQEVAEENPVENSENEEEIQVVDDEQQAEEAENSAEEELRASQDQEIINFIDSTLNAHQEQDEDQEVNVVDGSFSSEGSQGQEKPEEDGGQQQNEDLDLKDVVEHEQGEDNEDHQMEEQKHEEEEVVVSDDEEIVVVDGLVDEPEVGRQEEEQQVQEGQDQQGQDEELEVVEPENDVHFEEDGDVQIEENEDVQFDDRNQDTMDTADTEGDDVELDSESDERPDEMSEEDSNPVVEEVDTTNDGENDEVVIQDSEEEPQNTDDEIPEDA
ncbi:unnamed protein product [Bursaphelenchus xylophilus]|uniref:(pine wood nematode) hypothetical protein n=1 Tax=Bursaphelenchus xylophilus TaxID=6326 RepID=A0A1I7S830_BURXY|nr:unnamed protein product [Bursaphelenchus xylophilus]CAG9080646.1 unnamed protein product [Bursaphelenchus xylophilus]